MVQVDPIKPTLKAPGTQRLKLKHDEPPSNFGFKFNLRRYTQAAMQAVGIDGRGMTMSTAAFNLEAWPLVPSQLNCQSFRT